MKRFLSAACLVSMAAAEAVAAPGFSWFHTRPKPVVLVDEAGSGTAKVSRVQWHGTAMYPGSGRLYFSDKVDQNRPAYAPQTHSKMTTVFTRGWTPGSEKAAKPK